MTIFDIGAVLIGLSAFFGFMNHRYLHLPHTIGLVIFALISSMIIVAFDLMVPSVHIGQMVTDIFAQIDFHEALMNGMLSFLLFAGALHVNLTDLSDRKWAITVMATVGVLMSTFIIGVLLWWVLELVGVPIPLIWALVFGALISPTDPVAVLSIMKTVHIPKSLETKITGESLFNDGVGVVVFTIILAIAVGGETGGISVGDVVKLFVVEAIGGAVLGLIAGYIAYRAMRSMDEYSLEVLISLGLVMVTYAIANALHLSGPIAMVVAGLLIGNHGVQFAMSDTTRDHLLKFWTLLDEILNSILFLLIGLEVLVMRFNTAFVEAALLAIPIVLLARFISVSGPILLLSLHRKFTKGAIPALFWSGLRGGISVALAFSLPENEHKPLLLTITYSVVVFSIIVQGLTIKPLMERVVK